MRPAFRWVFSIFLLATLGAVAALSAAAVPRLEIEENPSNGGLAALRIAGDAMNWIEGRRTWGEIRRRPCTENNESEPYDVLVTRRLKGDTLHEEYLVTNTAPYDLFFNRGDFGIYATFNDSYASADVCETNRCHAHIWCGGEISWVHAKKMGPFPYELALVLREGSLETYSVERFTHEYSNDRGDIVLHPPAFRLRPHETMKIAWDLVAFEQGRFDETVRAHGGHIVRFRDFETRFPRENFEIEADGQVVRREPAALPYGEKSFELTVGGRRTVVRGYVSPPVAELVETRLKRMVRENQIRDEKSPLDGAFVIYDNEEGRPFFSFDNRDWNACRERITLGVALARWLRSHRDAAWARVAVERFERFVLREVYDETTGEVFDTIGKDPKYRRLYNAPWMITFWLERFAATGASVYLDRIERTVRHYYAGGGWRFYPNGCTFADVVTALRKGGRDTTEIEALVRRHVDRLMADGIRYPAHEVRFEQTIATPAVTIPLAYYLDVKRDPVLLEHLRACVDVLERFDGDQPDHRLGGIPIRHWDVRWFGKRMVLGDTFPHHWCVHSARAYALWAKATGEAAYGRKAERNLRNALCAWHSDGTATCGYLYPFSVTMLNRDGSVQSVHRGQFEDPWANDQDGALVLVLDFLSERK